MPAVKPPIAPTEGPSSMASTTVIRYISSGFAPPSLTWAKIVDWRSRAVMMTAVQAMPRRTTLQSIEPPTVGPA